MPRPKHANAAATRARILAAAGDAFASGGRSGASIRQIAKAAGVSLAMVHHYFGSKDKLYDACIDAMYAELGPMRESLLADLVAGTPLPELLERAVRRGFQFARAHQRPARLLFRQLTVAGQLDERRIQTEQRPFLDTTTAALAAATGRSPRSVRLPLQSAVVLVARYGISSLAELEVFADPPEGADVERVVEDHLVETVFAILAIPMENS